MKPCPCGSGKWFAKCCKPIITGKKTAITAEQLMRSRYSAYSRADIDYIMATMTGPAAQNFDPISAKQWAQQAIWQHLRVVNTTGGQQSDQTGTVEFIAYYKMHGQLHQLHEISQFIRQNGRWVYYDKQSS